jgi:hypothetical protein
MLKPGVCKKIVKDSEVPKEIQEDKEASEKVYVYKDGKCIEKVEEMGMILLMAELNAGMK